MKKGSFSDLFTMDENRHFHRTVLAYVNQMFQQISGINLITYYAATIYQNQIGLDPLVSRILAACNGTGKPHSGPEKEAFEKDDGLMLMIKFTRILFGLLDRRLHHREIRPPPTVSFRPPTSTQSFSLPSFSSPTIPFQDAH